MTATTAIDRFLQGICDPAAGFAGVFTDDAVLDATVPGWRFTQRGPDAVTAQLAAWYADPAHFDTLERTAVEGGEVVRFELSWAEHGVPHACHQIHHLLVRDGRIAADTVFCGGRWDAARLAEMGAAERART